MCHLQTESVKWLFQIYLFPHWKKRIQFTVLTCASLWNAEYKDALSCDPMTHFWSYTLKSDSKACFEVDFFTGHLSHYKRHKGLVSLSAYVQTFSIRWAIMLNETKLSHAFWIIIYFLKDLTNLIMWGYVIYWPEWSKIRGEAADWNKWKHWASNVIQKVTVHPK